MNPGSVRDTSPFHVRVLDSASQLLLAQTTTSPIVPSTEFETADLQQLSLEPSNPTVQEASSLRLSLLTTNGLSADARIEIKFPTEIGLASDCSAQTLTVQTMKLSAICSVSPASSLVVLSDLFYSYGYDPDMDKVLKLDLIDIISKNPASVSPNLAFTVTTLDLFDGAFSAVDSTELVIAEFNKAGSL